MGGIFVTGIFGNIYTKRGEFLTFRTGILGGLDDDAFPEHRTLGRSTDSGA